MEMLEIYNEKFEKTGKAVSREKAHREGYLHKTVHVWIVNFENRVIIQQRSLNKKNQPGKWDISCAGHISFGETPLEAAVKEVKEELGLEIIESLFTYISTFEKHYIKGNINDHEIYDTFLVRMSVDLDQIKYDREEVNAVSLMDKNLFFDFAEKNEDYLYNKDEYSLIRKILSKNY